MPQRRTTGAAVLLLAAVAAVAIAFSLRREARSSGRQGPLVGVKIYELAGDVPGLFAAWRGAGINAAFASPAVLANPEFRALARKNGVTTFVIFPVFFDAGALERRPELSATMERGEPAADSWVKFVCPTRADYRAEKAQALERLVRETDPDVVSLDFIRFFVFWEMVAPDREPGSLPQTCFDASCLADFSRKTGVVVPPSLTGTPEAARWILTRHAREWADWKCGVIADAVRELVAAARRAKPGVKVNLHAVPWRADDFGGAVRAVAGQDLGRLAPLVDFISPMCYHHMVHRPPEWVHSVVVDAARLSGAAILPSIQVKEAYIPGPETPAEFRAALLEALKPPSRGVVFWNWPALAESPEKLAAVREAVGPAR